MTAQIRLLPHGPEYNRNIERAIEGATGGLDTRIAALEAELMALDETATRMADALASMEQISVAMATELLVISRLLQVGLGTNDEPETLRADFKNNSY